MVYSELKGIPFEYTPELPKLSQLSLIPVASESLHSFALEQKVIQEYHERLQTVSALRDAREARNRQRMEEKKLKEIRRAPGYSSKPLEPTQSTLRPVSNTTKAFDFGEFEADYSVDPWEMGSIENELNVLQDVLSSSSNLTSNNSSPIKPLNAVNSSNTTNNRKFVQMGFLSQDVEIVMEKFGGKPDSEIIEYLVNFQNFKKQGYIVKSIIDAFERYDDYEMRANYCGIVKALSEMGFDYSDIKKVLIEKGLDLNAATDTLISKNSK